MNRNKFGTRRVLVYTASILILASAMIAQAPAPSIPNTSGETLSGRPIVLADALRSHTVVLLAGFSRQGGNGTGAWVRAIRSDPAFANMSVYQIAEIAGAPVFVRGMIKSGMKKGVPAAEQDHFVVLTQDEKPWRSYFNVSDDQVPYVVLLDGSGKVLWRGHGAASDLEPQLRSALR